MLRAFARASGVPDPGYHNSFDPYAEQVCLDVLARASSLEPSNPGDPGGD